MRVGLSDWLGRRKPDPVAELKEAILDVAPELEALPGFDVVFPERRILRLVAVSRIRNNHARRALMLATLPGMVLVNCWLVLWPCLWRTALLPVALPLWCWQNNRIAFQSLRERWNEPYTDDSPNACAQGPDCREVKPNG